MRHCRLIINADDGNLTSGVTRGILRCHDQGIVTSTTLLMNLPLSRAAIREFKKRKRLGLGVHLNVTLGHPLNPPSAVRTLIGPEGRFRRPSDDWKKRPSPGEIMGEYEAQIRNFIERFERSPDHLDTHHHLHDDPLFFAAVRATARRWKIPLRRSRMFQLERYSRETRGLKTTDFLFGNLEARCHWQKASFLAVAENLPDGTAEIGCHPGYCDSELRRISSMREVRAEELKVFSDRTHRNLLSKLGIELIRFSDL